MAKSTIKQDHERLLNNLKLLQKNFKADTLAKVLGIHENTWRYRVQEPWKRLNYDDFRAIAKYCGVSFTQLMDGELKIG